MHVRASSSTATMPHPHMLPSPIGGQQYVAPSENDGGKLGNGHGKVGGDELLPGVSLHTHEEVMQLLCVLGNKLGTIRDICFVFGITAISNPKCLVLAYPRGVLLEQHLASTTTISPHHQSLI